MKNTIILLALFSIVFISCKKDKDSDQDPAPTPTPVVKDFDYVKVGAKWVYNTSDSDPNHQGIIYEQTWIVKTKDADGWCTVDWALPGFTYTVEWFADATMFSNMASKAQQMKFPLIKANPVLNDTYSITYSNDTMNVTDTRVIKSLTESVTVPAGSYTNCVKIHETTSADSVYYKDYWIDKTVGIVRTEGTTKEDWPTIIFEELKSKQ
jgi:hypothetical protein